MLHETHYVCSYIRCVCTWSRARFSFSTYTQQGVIYVHTLNFPETRDSFRELRICCFIEPRPPLPTIRKHLCIIGIVPAMLGCSGLCVDVKRSQQQQPQLGVDISRRALRIHYPLFAPAALLSNLTTHIHQASPESFSPVRETASEIVRVAVVSFAEETAVLGLPKEQILKSGALLTEFPNGSLRSLDEVLLVFVNYLLKHMVLGVFRHKPKLVLLLCQPLGASCASASSALTVTTCAWEVRPSS